MQPNPSTKISKANTYLLWMFPLLAAMLTGCATVLPDVKDADIAFGLMGDTPYSEVQVQQLDALIEDMNSQKLAFVVHVGDIVSGNGLCTDEWFEARQRQFQKLRHPFILLPGDNDWVDCHRGGFDPLDRLNKVRQLFHSGERSIGQQTIQLERQSSNPRFAEYREHVRWSSGGVMFVGLNVQGSNNNLGRTAEMDLEHHKRMTAVLTWLQESMALADQHQVAGVVILAQANPSFDKSSDSSGEKSDGFKSFRDALQAHAKRFGKPMLFVHGDTHWYRQDHPLSDPINGKLIKNFVRIEVPGSPFVRWLKAGINSTSRNVLTVSPMPAPIAAVNP